MTFDLYFCSAGEPPTQDQIRSQFTTSPLFEIEDFHDGGFSVLYRNEDTGVYAVFDQRRVLEDFEDASPIPPPFVDSGLSMSLNLIRPGFFAEEVMQVVAMVADGLSLLVVDPQADAAARHPDPGDLAKSWKRANESTIGALFREQPELEEQQGYLPRTASDEWWRYQRARRGIEAELIRQGQDVFVPNPFLLRPNTGRRILRVISWPDSIPILLPPCDLLILGLKVKRRFSKRRDSVARVVPADRVRAALGDLLRRYPHEAAGLSILWPQSAARVRPSFEYLHQRGEPFDPTRFQNVGSDGFVDVDTGGEV